MTTNGVNSHANGQDGSFTQLKIKQDRLMDAIHSSCKFGADHRYGDDPTETGMARLSLNDADKEVRNWFVETAKSLGCKVSIDQMGNIFAVRPGKNSSAPPIFMGSHLDTQPTGGRYDGILGVNAGLEVLKTLHENNAETEGSIGCVDWTNEEGARFPMMAISSGVWSEEVPLETAWNLAEVAPSGDDGEKKTMKQELERIGFLGDTKASYKANPFAAHFELHIEQGPILEDEKRRVGVVDGAQAFKWFEITISGRDTHTGTTPFTARKDSMLCAAKCILQSNMHAKGAGGLATTGILEIQPGSINTIPKHVKFTLDIRHTSDAKLSAIEKACREDFARIAADESERGCKLEWKLLVDSPAVVFDDECISAVEASAKELCEDSDNKGSEGKLWKHMVSGAGHDSCYTSRVVPTSMIFVPTKEGVSHNPEEYCSPEDW